jgi:hypothetical protein
MLLSRRQMGAAAIGSLLAMRGLSAQGAKVSLKVGGQFQSTHPASLAMEEACAEIPQSMRL